MLQHLQEAAQELIENFCIINKNIWPLDQIDKMSFEEYSARSVLCLPNKFYKFFPDTEMEEEDENGSKRKVNYSITALETNEVYLCRPADFDDVFDSEIVVSQEEFEIFRLRKFAEWSNCSIPEDATIEETADIYLKHLMSTIQQNKSIEGIVNMVGYGEYEQLQAKAFVLQLSLELQHTDLGTALKNVIVKEYSGFIDGLKNTTCISCFTTEPMSQLMWGGSYANKHKGFCLEYTVSKSKEYEEILQNIKPLIYSNIRIPITRAIMNSFDKNWDLDSIRDLYMNGILRKSIYWAYQNEWRLVLPPQKREQQGFTKKFFPISKVYLGNRMPVERKKQIINICKQKGIPYAGLIRSPEKFEMKECGSLCENCWRANEK